MAFRGEFQTPTGIDQVDAVYSLTVALLTGLSDHDPEAQAALARIRASSAFEVAFRDGMWSLLADGWDVSAGFPEESVNALIEQVRKQRRDHAN